MFLFFPIDDSDGGAFVLKGESIQGELLLLTKMHISSHIVAEHGKITFYSKISHYLFSQPPYRALLWKHYRLLLAVAAHNHFDIPRGNGNVLSSLRALNHLKEKLNGLETYLWVLFKLIDYL